MAFSEETIQAVWEKGIKVASQDPVMWRQDHCTAWISRAKYGDRDSPYGWEIDHIKSQADGGGDELSNLRPLQWENNVSKQQGRLTYPVVSSGVNNAHR